VLLSTGQPVNAADWSRDGRIVLFTSRDPKSGFDIWALPLDGKPLSIVQTAFDEQGAQFAPDGHWIAYQSNESGIAEVYVRPFPGPGERFAVSIGGGTQVRWGRDGKDLFYVARDGRLMAVPIQLTSNTPDIGTPVALFPLPIGGACSKAMPPAYMVSTDSRQFLVATVKEDAPAPITVILKWKASR
jgi:Tol biopolymer transport system component